MNTKIRMKLLVMIVIVLSLFVACGKEGNTGDETAKNPTETENSTGIEIPTETEKSTETEQTTEDKSSEDTQSEILHTHAYVESVTTQATCDKEGVKTFACACGDAYTEPIKASGHAYVADEKSKKSATCTQEGKEADKVCSVCGDKVTGATIKKKSHSYGDYVYNNDATQSADGTKSKTCKVCGKVSTTTASGTKLPFDPYSLRAINDLTVVPVVGTMTKADDNAYATVVKNIKNGKYEKIRYVTETGDQFCMWNVRLKDERDKDDPYMGVRYYWFMAPIGDEFSDGYTYCNLTSKDGKDVDSYLVAMGKNISGSINESYINGGKDIPLGYREINSKDCPVDLYKIVETDTMVSVWVESTNCGQPGIGTCGSFDCKKTCLRYKTLEELRALPQKKGWGFGCASGENGRINWNGKLLVNFYYMKY